MANIDVLNAKNDLLDYVNQIEYKHQLSKTVGDDYFEPGMMENLEQYKGEYDDYNDVITLKTAVKGLRYDNRTQNLEKVSVGDAVIVIRESENVYNSNNFTVTDKFGKSLGNLPAELCNALAPLYDSGYAEIQKSTASYIEKINERSRYANQGVLFLELVIKLKDRHALSAGITDLKISDSKTE